MVANIPEKPTLDDIKQTWSTYWEEQGTYRFDRSAKPRVAWSGVSTADTLELRSPLCSGARPTSRLPSVALRPTVLVGCPAAP